jgi:spermidine synthase
LLVDGVVQLIPAEFPITSPEAGYWAAMVPDQRPAHALLLGLGIGTVARLLEARFGSVRMTGVDDDPDVVALAELELADLAGLSIVRVDAFAFVQRCEDRFDLACVDLFRGGQMEPGVVRRPFLRRLRALLAPRGLAAFNLFLDRRTATRLHRIERVFRVLRTVPAGKNLVVWAR